MKVLDVETLNELIQPQGRASSRVSQCTINIGVWVQRTTQEPSD